MRRARLKPGQQDHYYHVYNRIVGLPGELPFGRAEKERFLQILRRLAKYYVIDVISYQIMSNHYHLIVHVPCDPPSREEACDRYHQYYRGQRSLSPESVKCEDLRQMLRDLSCFMHDLQQQFATWFNKTRGAARRRGGLWAGRFKSTLLQEGRAVRACIIYTQMNPVRAGIVRDPGSYRFSSWGYWHAMGHQPFGEPAERHLVACFLEIFPEPDIKRIQRWLYMHYQQLCRDGLEKEAPHHGDRFITRVDRRTRYWAEAMAIGSELFVLDMLGGIRTVTAVHLVKSEDVVMSQKALWAYPRLRRVSR